jgi:hypothetical protein
MKAPVGVDNGNSVRGSRLLSVQVRERRFACWHLGKFAYITRVNRRGIHRSMSLGDVKRCDTELGYT